MRAFFLAEKYGGGGLQATGNVETVRVYNRLKGAKGNMPF